MVLQLKGHNPVVLALLLLAAFEVEGCASAKAGPRPDGVEPGGTIITRDQIQEMGVRNALEVIERGAKHLLIQRTREGSPPRIYHRGVDSIYLDAEVQVIVDGIPMNFGVQALSDIPSSSLDFIQILSAREGTTKYGAMAGAGVIIVKTTAG